MNLEVSGITVKFGRKVAVDNVSHTFAEGKMTVLMGCNGCGKTTLVKAMVEKFAPGGKISYVAQDVYGTVALSVWDVIALGRYDRSKFFTGMTSEDNAKIREAIEIMELQEQKGQIFDTLSGGEKQRCMVARAIAQDTEWIILDEPASNLDVRHTQHIMKTFQKLKEEKGKSFLIVIHDVNTAVRYADEFVLMKNGKITGCTDELTVPLLDELYDSSFSAVTGDGGLPVFFPK